MRRIQKQAIVQARRALGKVLPPKAQIHHVDGNTSNNSSNNLVICEDKAYHALLHLRTEALKATGDAHSRKCAYCKQWGVPGEGDMMIVRRWNRPKSAGESMHRSCNKRHCREYRVNKAKGLNPKHLT